MCGVLNKLCNGRGLCTRTGSVCIGTYCGSSLTQRGHRFVDSLDGLKMTCVNCKGVSSTFVYRRHTLRLSLSASDFLLRSLCKGVKSLYKHAKQADVTVAYLGETCSTYHLERSDLRYL